MHRLQNRLDAVVLVGGSTRMPVIIQAVAEIFEREPLSHLNPDEVVALGAATVADQWCGQTSLIIYCYWMSRHYRRFKTMGGLVEVLIPRNTPFPSPRSKPLPPIKMVKRAW